MRLEGKTVLITGAGSGIGRALAVDASRRGAHLLLVGRRAAPLHETAELASAGGTAQIVVGDVTGAETRAALLDAIERDTGVLDVLVNNAGTLTVGPLADLDDVGLDAMTRTNLTAPLALARDCLPLLRRSHGRIVNVGSMFGDIAYPYFAAYSATKFALRGASDALRRELAPNGIGVTYVAPRATQTDAAVKFDRLIEPFAMTLDTPEKVATATWSAVERDARSVYPIGMELVFVLLQRLFPALLDTGIGHQLARANAQPATAERNRSQHA